MDVWAHACDGVANVATSIDIDGWQLVLPEIMNDDKKKMLDAMVALADAD